MADAIISNSHPAKRVKTDADVTTDGITTDGACNTAPSASVSAAAIAGPVPLLVKKLSDSARLPTRGSAQAAGYDLYAARDTTVPARGKVLVDTDISIAVPLGACRW